MSATAATMRTIGALSGETARARTRRMQAEVRRQDRDDSPLLHPGAGHALVMAASALEDGPEPVAVVLADGTVRSLQDAATTPRRHATGRIAGRDWILWWERRRWSEA